jgi:type IV pilus assembly protein PilA
MLPPHRSLRALFWSNEMKSKGRTTQIDARSRRDAGFSLIELLIVVAIILIIAAIAVPNLLRSRQSANQAAAVANIRTISTASVSYWVTYSNGYPPSLPSLGGTAVTSNCNLAVLVDPILTTAPFIKTGFQFAYAGQQGNVPIVTPGCTLAGFNGYVVSATPTNLGVTGLLSYCSCEPGVIHYDPQGQTAATEAACNLLPTL